MPKKKALKKLEEAGLIVLPLAEDPGQSDSFALFKPKNTPGNVRPDWEFSLETSTGEILCDAPCATLDLLKGKWHFCIHEDSPDMGPGDFCQDCDSLEEAVEIAFAYYFGAPSAMNPGEGE